MTEISKSEEKLERIPNDLRKLAQWVGFRYEERQSGRIAKVAELRYIRGEGGDV